MHPKIKHMVKVMHEKQAKKRKKKGEKDWFLYVLKCKDGSFYTGVTNDVQRRFKMHENGKASKYTRARRPVKLIYEELCGRRADALVRECQVKAYSRKEKEELIKKS